MQRNQKKITELHYISVYQKKLKEIHSNKRVLSKKRGKRSEKRPDYFSNYMDNMFQTICDSISVKYILLHNKSKFFSQRYRTFSKTLTN